MSQTTETETLAEVLRRNIYGLIVMRPEHHSNCRGDCGEHGCPIPVEDYGRDEDYADIATAILASDWLTERTARLVVEAVAAERKRVWREGHAAGWTDALTLHHPLWREDDAAETPNPYRTPAPDSGQR